MKDNQLMLYFIAVPFMGRLGAEKPGFSQILPPNVLSVVCVLTDNLWHKIACEDADNGEGR